MNFISFFYVLGTMYFLVAIVFLIVLVLVMTRFYSRMREQLNRFSQLNFSHYVAFLVLLFKLFSHLTKKTTKKA